MYHIKNDQRAIRSSQMLYDGLARLMREKPFNAITVTDLVESAQVGRTTFYRNFDEIEDILRMRCDQTFDELITYVVEYLRQNPNEIHTATLKPMLRYFYLHSDIVELLMLAKRIDIIQDSFQARLQPFKKQVIARHEIAEEYVDYAIAIRIGVLTNILIQWIENGKRHAPNELANTLGAMIGKMVTLDQLL